jgi:predicted nucleotidyltransferase
MKAINTITDLFELLGNLEVCKKHGLRRIGVFGSFARQEKFNDIDLYIEDDLSFAEVMEIKSVLEKETGIVFDIMLGRFAEPVILHRAIKDMKYATFN